MAIEGGDNMDTTLLAILLLCAYFAPTVVAGARSHPQIGPIIVINLLLGWTFIGWVIALAMSVSAIKRET
jgi:hypothetical protein